MLQTKVNLQSDPDSQAAPTATIHPLNDPTGGTGLAVQRVANVRLAPPRKANQPQFPAARLTTTVATEFKGKVPVIIGEATYRGMTPVDGTISGQPGANGGTLTVRQRGLAFFNNEPELNGEINFIDMLRVNGHIAGSVYSKKGTLIVDTTARVDSDVEVCVALISGTVNGDIVAHQRVEIGPTAKICGNIWTRSLEIRTGAIFEGVCQMIEDKDESNQQT